MTVVGFLMMAHMGEPELMVEQARIMEAAGADVVYVTDSAGALTMEGVRARVSALREGLQCEVGFHAHNNLGLAVGNTVTALQSGATWIDGAMCGFGAGSGNAQTEAIVATLIKMGYETGIDLFKLLDVADEVVRPLLPRPQVLDSNSLVLGFAGVYSSFLLHAGKGGRAVRGRSPGRFGGGGPAQGGRGPRRHFGGNRIAARIGRRGQGGLAFQAGSRAGRSRASRASSLHVRGGATGGEGNIP